MVQEQLQQRRAGIRLRGGRHRPDTVHIRDSKNKEGAQLAFPKGPWADFVAHTAKG
ncbi:hypothetical protein SAV31267_030880 [Streptomyces avermitilis]|uniref:DUF397 domain-containing protein n=1 Tax=Streptomyces avermitilis TaxID=33903 RepID=A0A4D4MNB5_STRAX|nr:hypothetical protein SAV31267_030880 [Streptomyces avermitilis]